MQYLKIWMSFQEIIEPLSNEEVGSLLRMMLKYSDTGEPPTTYVGNERFIWAIAKQMIDAAESKVETLRQNGLKGGRPSKQGIAIESKEKQTKANESKAKQTEADESLNVNVKDNVKGNVKDKEYKERFVRFWIAYPRKTAKETALKAFLKIAPDEGLLQQMLVAIERQKKTPQWQEENGRFIPHPATWLNQKRWQDEVTEIKVVRANRADNFEQRDYTDVQTQMNEQLAREMEEFNKQQKGAV